MRALDSFGVSRGPGRCFEEHGRGVDMASWTPGRWFSTGVLVVILVLGVWLFPTVRATIIPVGSPLPGLTAQEKNLFTGVQARLTFVWTPQTGLGPVFTNSSCVGCHASPTGGGFNATIQNTLFGKINSDGSFNYLVNEGGPLLQPLSIASVPNSGNCRVPGEILPSNATVISKRQVPPLFGDGLIDAIPDSTILANAVDKGDGIHGTPNMSTDLNGNLRPGRFGFKAIRPTLLQLTADAFQHDIGVTNPIDPNEDLPQGNPIPSGCVLGGEPNDVQGHSLITIFQMVEFLAPHTPAPLNPAAQAGEQTFNSVGCAKCHTPSMQTASGVFVPLNLTGSVEGPSAALSSQNANLYSDLLLHDMGPVLADNFPQGQASGSQWRTTPLWGLSQKTVYLHDGRTSDLTTAIMNHGGEASVVIGRFSTLSPTDQSNLLAFLNTL